MRFLGRGAASSRRPTAPRLLLTSCAGLAFAAACDGGATDGEPVTSGDVCAVRLTEVALYQGVKVPLAGGAGSPGGTGSPGLAVDVDVVAGRAALVRAFVEPTTLLGQNVEAVLTLHTPTSTRTLEARSLVKTKSDDAVMASTLNFRIEPGDLTETTSWSLRISTPAVCAQTQGIVTRLPEAGPAPLRARATGPLRVHVVPIRYDADGSGRLPDLTDIQLEEYKRQLVAHYPIPSVELTVGPPVGTTVSLGDNRQEDGWVDLLDSVRELRAKDAPAKHIYYFGLIAPGTSFGKYCGGSCTMGIAYQSNGDDPQLRVGVGLGFTGARAAATLVHEIGHEHGLGHSFCGASAGLDSKFPHADGGIGTWGWDVRTNRLLSPQMYRDFMGYCSATWVSDYSYQRILERSASVNERTGLALTATDDAGARLLLVDAAGSARWGRPAGRSLLDGATEPASVLDEAGRTITEVAVRRVPLGDSSRVVFAVPAQRPGWHAIAVRGTKLPLPFAATPAPVLFPLPTDRDRSSPKFRTGASPAVR